MSRYGSSSNRRIVLKDKKVDIVRRTPVKHTPYPDEYYMLLDENLWAYYRAASQREINYAGTIGQSVTSIFIINWRADLKLNDFIEYEGNIYKIQFLDDFEGYKENIKITAEAINALPKVDPDGDPTKEKLKAPTNVAAELQDDSSLRIYWTTTETENFILSWYINYVREGSEWHVTDLGNSGNGEAGLHIKEIWSVEGDQVRLKIFPYANNTDHYIESDFSEIATVTKAVKTALKAPANFEAETTASGVVLTWTHTTDINKATYTLYKDAGASPDIIVASGLTDNTYTVEGGEHRDLYKLRALPTKDYERNYKASAIAQVEAPAPPKIKLGTPTDFAAEEKQAGGVVLTWTHGSNNDKGTYTIVELKAPNPDKSVASGLTGETYTHNDGVEHTRYKLYNLPMENLLYSVSDPVVVTATKEAPPEIIEPIKLGTPTDFAAVEQAEGGVLLTWLHIANNDKATYTITRDNNPNPAIEVASGIDAQTFTDASGQGGNVYRIKAMPIDPVEYEEGNPAAVLATEYVAPSKIQYPVVTNFTVTPTPRSKLNLIRFDKVLDDVVSGKRWAAYEVQRLAGGNEWESVSTDPRSNHVNHTFPEQTETYRVLVVTTEYSEATHIGSEPTEPITVENDY